MTALFIILIVLGSLAAFFGFNNVLWRIALKYNFRMAQDEFCAYHLLGMVYLLISLPDFDISPGQKTIDKYDPDLKRERKAKRELKDRENAFKKHITALEIDNDMKLSYPEFAPRDYNINRLKKEPDLQ